VAFRSVINGTVSEEQATDNANLELNEGHAVRSQPGASAVSENGSGWKRGLLGTLLGSDNC